MSYKFEGNATKVAPKKRPKSQLRSKLTIDERIVLHRVVVSPTPCACEPNTPPCGGAPNLISKRL